MINLDLVYGTTQSFSATPSDSLDCCGATSPAWVFRIKSRLTNETIDFLPVQIITDKWWETFQVGLTSGNTIAASGIVKITQPSTWDYEIWLTEAGASAMDPSTWISKNETGLLQVHEIVSDPLPSYGTSSTTPTFRHE